VFWSHVVTIFRVRTLTYSVAVAFGFLAYSGGVSSLPALAAGPSAPAPINRSAANATPAWLTKAMPYVHVTNFVAVIDPSIARVLTKGQVATVRADVAAYNATPLTLRSIGATGGLLISVQVKSASYYSACYGYIRVHSYNWWGMQFYLNDCYAQGIALGVGLFAVAATVLYLIPGLNVAVVALQIMLGAASGSIMWADQHCGWNGVYLNVPWVPAAVWGSSIC
jgi:hypothetical protein